LVGDFDVLGRLQVLFDWVVHRYGLSVCSMVSERSGALVAACQGVRIVK
jgi:hypothetical protein